MIDGQYFTVYIKNIFVRKVIIKRLLEVWILSLSILFLIGFFQDNWVYSQVFVRKGHWANWL